jgi:hypothetical protein
MRLKSAKIKRNALCACGSGKKTKKCCMGKIKNMQLAVNQGINPASIIVSSILDGWPDVPPESVNQPDPVTPPSFPN